jgi:hypothetical protein
MVSLAKVSWSLWRKYHDTLVAAFVGRVFPFGAAFHFLGGGMQIVGA